MAVLLLGRPNVGKSSLFNRLIGRRQSLVWDQPGITRDRLSEIWTVNPDTGHQVELWDLPGWGLEGGLSEIPKHWKPQIELVLLVVDGSEALSSLDRECLRVARKLGKEFLVIANKSDKKAFEIYSNELAEITGRAPLEISAERKEGIEALCREVESKTTSITEKQLGRMKSDYRVLVLGRPNVGKSSLVNRLAGQPISLVSEVAGTTRDIVEARVRTKGKVWNFVDTAGVRKKSKLYGRNEDPIEIFSAQKALQELQKVDFCVFLIEPHPKGLMQTQDKKLLKLVRESRCTSLIAVNKWDLLRTTWKWKNYETYLKDDLGEMGYLKIIPVSAQTGFGVKKLVKSLEGFVTKQKKVPTPQLNRWLTELQRLRPPKISRKGTKTGKIRTQTQYLKYLYMVQTREVPLRFQVFTNAPQAVSREDKRYLERSLRESFGFEGLPIEFQFKAKSKPNSRRKSF